MLEKLGVRRRRGERVSRRVVVVVAAKWSVYRGRDNGRGVASARAREVGDKDEFTVIPSIRVIQRAT